MSINSALQAGVSGLLANSAALATISDNIANANTVGYKTMDTEFGDIVTNSSIFGDYDAGGVLASTRQLVTQQGELAQTTSNTDLAIVGQGFFVTTPTDNPSVTDTRNFTRAGSFTLNAQGYLENADGGFLQGWPVNADGTVTMDPSSLSSLQTINVADVGGAATPTTMLALNANLDASQPPNAAVTGGVYSASSASTSMAAYDANNATGTKPDFTIDVPISDSQGGQRDLQLDLIKGSSPNTWQAELVSNPASDVTGGAVPGQVAAGTVVFNADGSINMSSSTLFQSGAFSQSQTGSPVLNIGASSAAPAAGQVSWSSNLGVAAQTLAFNVDTAPGGLTQYASASVTQSVETNGTQFGNLTNIDIDDQGFVTAVYDNGISRKIAQVAVATFPNPDGLKSVSGDNYQVSSTSGTFNLKAAGSGGAGEISPGTLESSTVDLSQQFAGLIVTQQAYAASTKILTTADQMLQTLISVQQ